MKHIILFVLVICTISVKSQKQELTINTKNAIHFKSNIISEILTKNDKVFNSDKEVVYDKVLGTDVHVFIDTLFKKYTLIYKDKDYEPVAMIYEYVKDFFTEKEGGKSTGNNKVYLMKMGDTYFMLSDFRFLNLIEIQYTQQFVGNSSLVYAIKELEYVPK